MVERLVKEKYDTIVENDYWDWYDLLLNPNNLYKEIYDITNKKCTRGQWRMMGSLVREPKRSIIIEDHTQDKREAKDEDTGSYLTEGHKSYDWEEIPIVKRLGDEIYNTLGIRTKENNPFDYCLVNIYDDGKDGIGWHNDREAGETDIVSISLGCTRLFGLRPIHKKNNGGRAKKTTITSKLGVKYTVYKTEWTTKLPLQSGHVVHMKERCQKVYKHSLFKTKSKKEAQTPRINLTYRRYSE